MVKATLVLGLKPQDDVALAGHLRPSERGPPPQLYPAGCALGLPTPGLHMEPCATFPCTGVRTLLLRAGIPEVRGQGREGRVLGADSMMGPVQLLGLGWTGDLSWWI